MSLPKGQSDIIAVILVVLIAIGLVSVAYAFGIPLIEKSQDRAIDSRVRAFFDPGNVNSLPEKVKTVANNGGTESINLDVNGQMTLDETENSISFLFRSRVTSIAPDLSPPNDWVSLTGEPCPSSGGAQDGFIGISEPFIVCAKSVSRDNGFFDVTYKMYMRELDDAEQKNGFLVQLKKNPISLSQASGSDVTTRLEFGQRSEVNKPADPPDHPVDRNLITTDVQILLV